MFMILEMVVTCHLVGLGKFFSNLYLFFFFFFFFFSCYSPIFLLHPPIFLNYAGIGSENFTSYIELINSIS